MIIDVPVTIDFDPKKEIGRLRVDEAKLPRQRFVFEVQYRPDGVSVASIAPFPKQTW